VIWTAFALASAVFFTVGGWYLYGYLNHGGVPAATPASKKTTVSPAELKKDVEKQAADPAESAASAGPVPGVTSKPAPTPDDEKTLESTPGNQSSKKAEQPKSQK
jgi:hypothetical protein